jgi:DnaJ like chaperone protein
MKETAYFFSGLSDLIAMLCKMAKGDGVITEDEIAVVDDFFINVLKLGPEKRREAIDIFQKSKQSDTPFEVYAREFYSKHKEKKELLEAAIDLLTCVAFADGELSAEEEILLNQAIIIFGVDASRYKEYKEAYNEQEVTSTDVREERYYARILGLQDDITPEKVKSSYRKLAVQYHPDKVSHLGIKIKKVAESEMKKINEAYEYFQKQYSL